MKDKIALVTGASSGIGAAIARRLSREGARLVLLGRDGPRLREVAESLVDAPLAASRMTGDLADARTIERLTERVLAAFGGVDILIHSAAVFTRGPVLSLSLEQFDRQYAVNLRAPYLLTQLLLPSLLERRGQVVFVNSTSGKIARAGIAAYAASKFGLRALAETLREEVGPQGVRVFTVYPGRTATPMQELVTRLEGKAYEPATLLQPEDVAELTVAALKLPPSADVFEIDVRQPWA
jgi:NAD(P)-dependent dehydrogenase (short-subunit alcohol dehydrogenase family)